jgi:hypothetical protein
VSVEIPKVAVVFGAVAVPQDDVVQLRVHLGCTKEVSSFEVQLQNWDGKYSQGGASPITVGMDGHVDMGRGVNVPQVITCRVEGVKYESTPCENYLSVSGRCWGEKLFRRVVTKTFENKKGEDVVKELLDYYVGLSHVRGSTELVEDTDTTYTKLEYEDTPVFDVFRYVAESADKAGVIGYDFRVAPDGQFEFFPVNSRTSSVSLADKIESSEYRRDIHQVRNRITIYGAADKSVPLDKDAWTESLTPSDGVWSAVNGAVSFDTGVKVRGSGSVKENVAGSDYYAACLFTLNTGKEVNANLYPLLNFWVYRESTFTGNMLVSLYDTADRSAHCALTVAAGEWFNKQVKVGVKNADGWRSDYADFDWANVKKVRFYLDFPETGSGSFWVDGLFFGGCRYSAVEEDVTSQGAYGLRELVDVDEELFSDGECDLRVKALLNHLKEPAEYLTVRSTVVDYGSSPILPGDKVHVTLPNECVDADFRVLSVEYAVDARTQTLENVLELGRERSVLADYLYALRSRSGVLSRRKAGRLL